MSRHPILYIHPSNELYGSDRALLGLVQGLDKKKYAPYIMVANDLPYERLLTDQLENIDIPYLEFKLGVLRRKYQNPRGLGLFSYHTLLSARQIAAFCRANHVRLIHSNSTAVFSGGLAAKWLGIPHIWHVREIITQPVWLSHIIAHILHRYADLIVAVSGPTRDHLLAVNSEIQDKIIVINDGIDPGPFVNISRQQVKPLRGQWGASDTTTVVGMVGRYSSWKGQDYLLDAAAAILNGRNSTQFVFVGGHVPGEEWRVDKLQKKVKELGLSKHIFINGFRFDVPEIMAAFDVFVLPSTRPDPFPNVVLEAMASGKPVIATAHGGPAEQLLNGETGYLVSPTKPEQLVDALEVLIADPELRRRMGEAGQKRLINNFTTDRYMQQIEALYTQILN